MTTRIGDVPPPTDSISRYSSRPFPVYRYVPGVHPHPTRDPAGHSYEPQPKLNRHAPWRLEDWRSLDDWLYGIDLFNARYFWEAHEAWEGLWAARQRDSEPALLMQGLIQIAAALLKIHLRSPAGVFILSSEGIDKLEGVARQWLQPMGLDLPAVIAAFRAYFEPLERDQLPSLEDAPVLRLRM